jgi:uncharacterized protein YkwD
MQTLQTVRKGALLSLVCLILFSATATAWSTNDMDAKMNTMQAEMDATFATTFDAEPAADHSDPAVDGDTTTNDWAWNDGTADHANDPDQEMDRTFGYFGSSDDSSDTGNQDTTDDSTNRDTGDSGSSDDGTSDDRQTDGTDREPTGLEAATEQRLHELINDERQERGLQPFNWDSGLANTADYKSADMADSGYFDHTSPTGEGFRDIYSRFGYGCRIPHGGTVYLGGENIARTWFNRDVQADHGGIVHYDTAAELADGLRRQWMTSDGHRKAILRPYYENHGLGVEITDDGRVYATEHFC